MYADSLIIMSESAAGLQHALDKLYHYCMKWKLVVNIDKSNVMIFNKSGHLLKSFNFKYGKNALHLTSEYCYLGIIFVPSGSFAEISQNTKIRNRPFFFTKIISLTMKWKIIFVLFLAHVIDLEKTHLAAEFHHSGTFSLGAMTPFGIFVKCETGK